MSGKHLAPPAARSGRAGAKRRGAAPKAADAQTVSKRADEGLVEEIARRLSGAPLAEETEVEAWLRQWAPAAESAARRPERRRVNTPSELAALRQAEQAGKEPQPAPKREVKKEPKPKREHKPASERLARKETASEKESPKEPKPEAKREESRTWNIIGTVLAVLIVLGTACMVAFTLFSLRNTDQSERNLFGYKAFIVRSDSMSATDFSSGDLVIVKEINPLFLTEGDIIAFISRNPENYGETFTHKIRRIVQDEESGETQFITYGTTTDVDDLVPVSFEDVMGRYVLAVPKMGVFFSFLKTVPGYLCCIFLPFALLMALQLFQSLRLSRRLAREEEAERQAVRQRELAEIEQKRQALEAESEKNRRLLEELRRRSAEP